LNKEPGVAEHDCCLIIFAKEPVPGQVKHRLSAEVGQDQAMMLYKAFLKDTYTLSHFIPVHFRVLAYDSFGSIPEYLYSVFPHFIFYPQHGRDFGERIQDAIGYAKHMGALRIVIIRSDSPTLPAEVIMESFQRLREFDVVLGPGEDGGVYLFGAKNFYPGLFEDVGWDGGRIFQKIKINLRKRGKSYYVLPDWYDIDRLEDLAKLNAAGSAFRADSTAVAMRKIRRYVPHRSQQ